MPTHIPHTQHATHPTHTHTHPRSIVLLFAAVAAVAVALPLASDKGEGFESVVRVNVTGADVIAAIGDAMVWTEGGLRVGRQADVVASQALLDRLRMMNAPMEVMIGDMNALIAEQAAEFAARDNADDYNKNYHSVAEITERLKYFAKTFPNVDFIESLGSSLEGRAVPVLRFGRRSSGAGDDVPTIWLQCNQHAREFVTAATCMYFTQKLLEGAAGDYKDIFDSIQIYVAPMINPDGFTYALEKSRLWRKNRRQNKDGSYGVDLNRNWGSHWGGEGASTSPSSDTYRGTKAFSEPETANVVAYLKKLETAGNTIEAAIDFHCYSQLILRPYGWTTPNKATPPNDATLKALGDKMRDIIKGVHGTVLTSEHAAELYVASGGADDWFAAEATKQNNGLTYELRDTGRYGFLLPASQIIPSGEEILPAVVYYARNVLENALARRAAAQH